MDSVLVCLNNQFVYICMYICTICMQCTDSNHSRVVVVHDYPHGRDWPDTCNTCFIFGKLSLETSDFLAISVPLINSHPNPLYLILIQSQSQVTAELLAFYSSLFLVSRRSIASFIPRRVEYVQRSSLVHSFSFSIWIFVTVPDCLVIERRTLPYSR